METVRRREVTSMGEWRRSSEKNELVVGKLITLC